MRDAIRWLLFIGKIKRNLPESVLQNLPPVPLGGGVELPGRRWIFPEAAVASGKVTGRRQGGAALGESDMWLEGNVQELFQQYQEFFRNAIKGEVDMEQGASFYATRSSAPHLLGSWLLRTMSNSDWLCSKALKPVVKWERRTCAFAALTSRRSTNCIV